MSYLKAAEKATLYLPKSKKTPLPFSFPDRVCFRRCHKLRSKR